MPAGGLAPPRSALAIVAIHLHGHSKCRRRRVRLNFQERKTRGCKPPLLASREEDSAIIALRATAYRSHANARDPADAGKDSEWCPIEAFLFQLQEMGSKCWDSEQQDPLH
jgi:hypothetical protein